MNLYTFLRCFSFQPTRILPRPSCPNFSVTTTCLLSSGNWTCVVNYSSSKISSEVEDWPAKISAMFVSFTASRVSPQLSCSIKLTMSRRNLPPPPFRASRTLTSAAEMRNRCRWSSRNQTRIRAHAKQPSAPLVSMISAVNLAGKAPQSLENYNDMNTSRLLL